MLTRRQLLTAGASAAFFPTLGLARPSLKLLILGGTGFLGPHTVQAAVERGHQVTLFNRGRTNAHLFPTLEKLRGNRDGDLRALEKRRWDAVIDSSGHLPRLVGDSARLLAPNVKQYLFVSSISVYADLSQAGITEQSPVSRLQDSSTEEITATSYGALKALSEQAAERYLPDRTTVLRCGLIVGPRDRTDRFTYWPVRLQRGGRTLAPGVPDAAIQFIDVRDVAGFIIRCLERRLIGTYNTDRPASSLTMQDFLRRCQRGIANHSARLVWASEEFLRNHQIRPWSDMPLWMPREGPNAGFGEIDCSHAASAGLAVRPVEKTARDTLEWFSTQPKERQSKLRAGLRRARETSLLRQLGMQR